MCRHVAPVGHVTHNESFTPHGIALVASMQRQGRISWDASSLGVLYAEPDGGNCQSHCVTNQPLPAAIAAIRAEVAAQGLAPLELMQINDQILQKHSVFGRYEPAQGQGNWGLFVGDSGFNLLPSTMQAVLQLLEIIGIHAVPVGCGLDSGFIPCSLGYPDTAKKQAQLCIDEIQDVGVKKLLVLSPQDLFAFRYMYEERLGITPPEEVAFLDLLEFFAEQVKKKDLNAGLSIDTTSNSTAAYVDPTHAVRLPSRFDAARELSKIALKAIPLELFWRRDRAHPVGSTAIQFTRPDIGIRLTESRLEDALSRGATAVICEDPATLYELQLRNHTTLGVQGLYERLLERFAAN